MLNDSTVFGPSALFAGGAQGAFYDPSDFSTLFQNSAGTTAVTAVEQPVGYMADKSGRGNHATQATSASRPTLRARYNLLTYSEQFDDGAWTKTNSSVTANAAAAPDGTTTADKLVENSATDFHTVRPTTSVGTIGATETLSVFAKASERSWLALQVGSSRTAYFNLSAGTIGTTSANTTATMTALANGWYRCSVAGERVANQVNNILLASGDNTASYTGDGTSGIFIWGAQLLTAADQTTTAGAYQRIAAATDYATGASFPPYLAFDGTDDSFSTGSIDFSGTDEMTVFAGLTKLSDAAVGVVAELSPIFVSNNGSFNFGAPGDAGTGRYSSGLRGTSTGFGGVETFSAPITNVVTQQLDIGQSTIATEIVMRVNGTQQTLINTSSPTTAGTGNFGNFALFLGRRNNASLPFNGRIYSLIVLGRTATASGIASTETWINGKARAY